jgi:hypothetical protein
MAVSAFGIAGAPAQRPSRQSAGSTNCATRSPWKEFGSLAQHERKHVMVSATAVNLITSPAILHVGRYEARAQQAQKVEIASLPVSTAAHDTRWMLKTAPQDDEIRLGDFCLNTLAQHHALSDSGQRLSC